MRRNGSFRHILIITCLARFDARTTFFVVPIPNPPSSAVYIRVYAQGLIYSIIYFVFLFAEQQLTPLKRGGHIHTYLVLACISSSGEHPLP